MQLIKLNKSHRGRMTFQQELISYFRTSWTLNDGNFYLDCVNGLSEENKKLIDMLLAARQGEVT